MDAGIGVSVIFVAIAVGIFAAGYFTQKGQSAPTASAGSNDPNSDCEGACRQWQARRTERCTADRLRDTAKNVMDIVRADYWGAVALLGVAIGALFAAIAAGAATLGVLAYLIPAAKAAVVLATIAVDFWLGKLTAATDDFNAKTRAANDAFQAEADARAIVISKCPEEKANQCFSVPQIC